MEAWEKIIGKHRTHRSFVRNFLLCFFAWVICNPVSEAAAATITVCSSGCNYSTVQNAITNASADDLIDVQYIGEYTEAGITVNKNLTIQGQGSGSTTLQAAASEGSASDRVFEISASTTVTIKDMTVRYGKVTGDPAQGGGIYSAGTLTLTDMTVSNCQAVADDKAYAYGGGIYSASSLTMTNVTVSSNSATGGDSIASADGGHAYGGGIYSNGTANLTDSTVTGNTATGGDEVLNVSTAGSAYGGGIYNASGNTLTITRGSVTNNDADGGDAWINTASGGSAYGGGVYNDGTVQVSEATFSGNEALGGFDIAGFSGNGGNAHGGGIFNNTGDTFEISKSTISGNTAQGGDDIILIAGSAKGGGIYQEGDGDLDLQNITISGNEALRGEGGTDGAGDGGGLWGANGFYVTNCTIANNVAEDDGGGFFSNAATDYGPWIKNSVFGDNTAGTAGPDLKGNFRSDDYNLIHSSSDYTLTEFTDHNIEGQDPQLGNLSDYGGDTQTILLCKESDGTDNGCNDTDSPAIDVITEMEGKCGFSPPYNVDQRGVSRPYNSGLGTGDCSGVTCCDIGAYERTGSTLVVLVSFDAREVGKSMGITWETASEIDTAGFHLWRSGTRNGTYQRLTSSLIPAEGSPTSGATYNWNDTAVAPPQVWYYKLEEISTSGGRGFHGPVAGVLGDAAAKEVNGSATIHETDTAGGLGDITLKCTGTHMVTTGRYGTQPAGTSALNGVAGWWFVDVTDPSDLSRITLRFCPAESRDMVYYWNGSAWIGCSQQAYQNGCIEVTMTGVTTPTVSDLSTLVFALGQGSAPIPTVSEWGLMVLALFLISAGLILVGRRGKPSAKTT